MKFEYGSLLSHAFVPAVSVVSFPHMVKGSRSLIASPPLLSSIANDVAATNDVAADRKSQGQTVVVAGATGYIGKAVVRESLRQGYKTIAIVRDSAKAQSDSKFTALTDSGAVAIECDVTNYTQVVNTMDFIAKNYCGDSSDIAAVVSCLASRSGVKKDAYLIDYEATNNCLQAGIATRAKHFILLSAFCVQKPILQFQQAKLKFEAILQSQKDLIYTIVRPTAFFKSVSGQLEVVQSGAPFVMFDKGRDQPITACNPIAESDLATYMIDSIRLRERHNKIFNLGGPDEPISMQRQGEMLFSATGKEPKFVQVPSWIFDVVINTLQFFADLTKSEELADAAETGRIGKYYAVEDMVTTDPNEKYGTITLQEHYNRIAIEGNEYDPYTTMFARARGIDVNAIQNEMKNVNNTATVVAK